MSAANLTPQPSASAKPSRTLIVGLGKTGLSCAHYLAGHGELVAVTDSRERPPGLEQLRAQLPDVAVFSGGFAPEAFTAATRLIVSPGVSLAEPLIVQAQARGVPVLGDVELFARAASAPVCAITGSNGKSTVTTLLGLMARRAGLRTAVGGNLGEPVLDLLAAEIERYVVELSSFQLETTESLHADVAVVLNVSPDHLDRYRNFADYTETKARIYRQARVAVINRDDPLVSAMSPGNAEVIGFTLNEPSNDDFGLREIDHAIWLCRGKEALIATAEVALAGRHNLANALAALALAAGSGIDLEAACGVLREFRGLAHRSELVAEHAGVRWYDDSKGTNPGATIAALDGLIDPARDARAVLIAGGESKNADFEPLAPAVARSARAVVLIGRDAELLATALADTVPLVRAGDMTAAVREAAALARPGDCVLLSPACASFDMFDGYAQRGEAFARAVREVIA